RDRAHGDGPHPDGRLAAGDAGGRHRSAWVAPLATHLGGSRRRHTDGGDYHRLSLWRAGPRGHLTVAGRFSSHASTTTRCLATYVLSVMATDAGRSSPDRRRAPGPATSGLRRVHHLQLAELLDPPLPVLPAEPAPLDAAERDLGAHAHGLIDPGGAALEALGDLLAARDVGGPHRAAEAVVRAVRLRERIVEIAPGDDGEGRAELLLVDWAHALADVGHDGRRVE